MPFDECAVPPDRSRLTALGIREDAPASHIAWQALLLRSDGGPSFQQIFDDLDQFRKLKRLRQEAVGGSNGRRRIGPDEDPIGLLPARGHFRIVFRIQVNDNDFRRRASHRTRQGPVTSTSFHGRTTRFQNRFQDRFRIRSSANHQHPSQCVHSAVLPCLTGVTCWGHPHCRCSDPSLPLRADFSRKRRSCQNQLEHCQKHRKPAMRVAD